MNRLRSVQANANLTAGEEPGTSRIAITEQQTDRFRGTLGYDNLGSPDTGRAQLRFGFEADDLLGWNDTWSLSYSGARNSNALAFSGSVPWRKWLFSLSASYSETLSPVSDTSDLFSETKNLNLTAERLLFRDARRKFHGYISLSSYRNERFINIAALAPQRRSALRFGLRQEHRMERSVISADTSVSFGSGILGGDLDPDPLPSGSPVAQFKILETRLSYIRPYENGNQLSLSLTGQISNASLYSEQQFSIGGWGTVRGYAGNGASGDSGAYLRTELSFPSTTLDITSWGRFLEKSRIPNPFNNATGGLRPFLFADIGYVYARATGQSTTLAGFGAGISAQLGRATFNGTVAIPLLSPSGRESGDPQLSVSLIVKTF